MYTQIPKGFAWGSLQNWLGISKDPVVFHSENDVGTQMGTCTQALHVHLSLDMLIRALTNKVCLHKLFNHKFCVYVN